MTLEERVLALEEALLGERARNDAHLLMITAILNGLREGVGGIGAYSTALRSLAVNNLEMTKTNEHGATLRELRLVLDEMPEPSPQSVALWRETFFPSPAQSGSDPSQPDPK